jgi:hypothetical protein
MDELTKEQLIEQIKELISIDGSKVDINPAYLEYFQLEELEEIKQRLLKTKESKASISKDYLDEIYEICGT